MCLKIKDITEQFQIYGDFVNSEPYGTGHINDTFLINFNQGGTIVPYIFQRINHNVFKDPPLLMENIVRVTSHIRKKLEIENINDISRRVLTVIFTKHGLSYYNDPDGNFWRAYFFITNAKTYDILHSTEQIYQVARTFGLFQKMLADFPDPPLHETIPDFHNGPKRFVTFQRVLKDDCLNKAKNAGAEIDFLLKQASIFDVLQDLAQRGKIPLRITHNDTKINNIPLDISTGEGVCVLDLDTVMPGLSLYDFGDLARTTLSTAAEDEQDLSKVKVDMKRFEYVFRGYLSTVGEAFNQVEKNNLVLSIKMITQLIGMRFLTDYLLGDIYFKIHRKDHNLERCRSQFKLVQSVIENEEKMLALIDEYFKFK